MFVDAFLANYTAHFDFAKASKFAVLIFQPPGLQLSGGLFGGLIGQNKLTAGVGKAINTASLSFQIESAVLPGYQINTVEQQIHGAPFTSVATAMFEPLQLSIICAGDLWERKFIEDWMEIALPRQPFDSIRNDADSAVWFNPDRWQNARSPFTAGYRDAYCTTIQIVHFHDTGVPIARYKFIEAFPTVMASQPVNWGDDGILRLQVSFNYRTYEREENVLKKIWSTFKTEEEGDLFRGQGQLKKLAGLT